jgi:hypothetical protein
MSASCPHPHVSTEVWKNRLRDALPSVARRIGGLPAQSSNISSIAILNMLLQGTKSPRRQIKQGYGLFLLQRRIPRLYGRYIPKDTSCTMSHYDRKVRRDGDFFADISGKIGVEA